ncbi:oxygenase MpaB family protein [Nocardia sp. NBC_01503]|uniref:oxygenase MpaB family protein n=1 Tax=Nocardia sp. NBC_01503 TaxID=2975997 RepID=UPI002E7C15D9|nr:oxygenase MpaB family protein [Nocardia sp. NBC_01503]WTL35815.1 oxygenase MpaB family protein [Nocardia sp. NBC_01503]
MTRPVHAQPYGVESEPSIDIRQFIDGAAGLLGGAANVIMQLAHPPVGYGVVESPVESGNVMVHPIKRLRTTITYLAVALMGTEADREAYRAAVDTSHRQVRSKPGSAVKYNAFDPKLQLWVAACLYWGSKDLYERMHGPMNEADAEAFYQYSSRLGTTLQMRREMWPVDRVAFEAYWAENLAKTSIDPHIRAYFEDLIDLRMLPRPVGSAFGGIHRFFVTGLLPQHLRDEMGMTWTPRQDRLLARIMRTVGAAEELLPTPVRIFPINVYLMDMRLRCRLGLRLV